MGTTMKVLTISEFLLARIAEDAAAVNSRTRHLAPRGWSYEEQFGDFGDDERWMIEIPAARVLAECEAKRRVVEDVYPDLQQDADALSFQTGALADPRDILRLLALPYSDHPDYREEWRV